MDESAEGLTLSGVALLPDLGEWLAAELERRGMSQADLVRASGLHDSTVTLLLKGDRKGSRPDTQRRLAQAFRVPWEELVAAVTEGRPLNPVNHTSDAVADAIMEDRDLTHDQKAALLTTLRTYRR